MSLYKFEVKRIYTQTVYVEAEEPDLAVLAFEEGKATAGGPDDKLKQNFVGYDCRNTNSTTEDIKYADYKFKGEV